MTKRSMLITCLKHYCDMIWEYDRRNGKIFIYYDTVAREYTDRAYTVSELIGIFRDEFGIGINDRIWKKYLNEEYLKGFFTDGKDGEELELQFLLPSAPLKWYRIRIEKNGEESLIISGKDMCDEFKERSLYNSVRESFDNITSICLETGTCVVIHARNTENIPIADYNYGAVMNMFVEKYVPEEEKEQTKASLALDYAVKKLENAEEYIIYINTVSENRKGCKKITFSYADKAHKFITFTTFNIGEIVGRYEYLVSEIKKENYKDSLTGAYNRNYYETNLKLNVFSGGVAVLDVDNFKLCNDTRGHAAGDAVLARVSAEIRKETVGEDFLVRFGGDEFLLIMPGATAENLENTLERIQKRIKESTVDSCGDFPVTLSMGGAISKNEVMQDAVYRADRLMYRAKSKKNAYITEQNFYLRHDNNGEDDVKQQILIVDDSPLNREMLSKMIGDEFETLEAENGKKCLEKLKEYGTGISLVLLDIIMPEMDGLEVLSEMKRLHYTDDIPVIMISVDMSDSNIRRAFDLGVTDYISRPFDSKVVMQRIHNTVRLYSKQQRLTSLIARQHGESINNEHIMTDVLSGLLGRKNGESAQHIRNIRKITEMLLERLILKTDKYGLSWRDCDIISEAPALHDVGKIEIDSAILNKPGKLTPEEREIVKQHTVIGEEILLNGAGDSIKNEPMLETAAQICRWHHERYDGSGYPDGLKGDEIPIAAQVVSLADVYDALVSRRVYKEPYSGETALSMILAGECGSFNPLLTECLCNISDKLINDIYSKTEATGGNT